jgi:hypothetical protein
LRKQRSPEAPNRTMASQGWGMVRILASRMVALRPEERPAGDAAGR